MATCECGCGQSPPLARQTDRSRGWVAGKPIRFVPGHHTRLPRPGRRIDPIRRLMSKVQMADSGCWVWLGSKTQGGYGHWALEGNTEMAHRIAYKLLRGDIPDGMTLDHLCRTRACVNPNHLDPVSIRDNLHRAPTTVNALNAAKSACKRGHPFSAENTYTFGRGFRQCRECVRLHGQAYRRRRRSLMGSSA